MRSRPPSVCEQRLVMAGAELLVVVMLLAETAEGHLGTVIEPKHGSYVNGVVDGDGDENDESQRTGRRNLGFDITQLDQPVECRRNAIGKGDRLKVLRALRGVITSFQRSRTVQNQGRPLYAGRLIHARVTSPGDFPFHALVLSDNKVICSGALISESTVLTAAQCVFEHEQWLVQLGSVDLLVRQAGRQMMYGAKVEIHPDYDGRHTHHDIAVVFLEKPAVLNDLVQTARLPTDMINEDLVGKRGIVGGWGRTEITADCSQTLLYAPLTVNPNENCRVYFPDYDPTVSFCAGGKWGASVCNGDNGSPLMFATAGGYRVLGVASFVFSEFCLPDFPTGFTRVSAYLGWISQTTGIKLT